jgi:tetratricopeptide (TPR) repeat protein
MQRPGIVHRALALAAFVMSTGVGAEGLAAFSAALDAQWNYNKPAESERRFRDELGKWPAGDPQALVTMTQIARAQSLRGRFAEAHATLADVEPKLGEAPSHVRVRYLLERGRTFNSAGSPSRAVPLFSEAMSLAQCNGDDFYAIDAAHMLGIAAPGDEKLDWNVKALAMTERTTDVRSKRWLASLNNNIGQTYLEKGDYKLALVHFERALPAWKARGDEDEVRFARWKIARAQRSLGQLDAAETTQRALLAEYEQLGEPDGYVFEELAEIALGRGQEAAAAHFAARAHAVLSRDDWLTAHEPQRLTRLAEMASRKAVSPPR